jgi:Fe-S cluster biogenesis protein NfuA
MQYVSLQQQQQQQQQQVDFQHANFAPVLQAHGGRLQATSTARLASIRCAHAACSRCSAATNPQARLKQRTIMVHDAHDSLLCFMPGFWQCACLLVSGEQNGWLRGLQQTDDTLDTPVHTHVDNHMQFYFKQVHPTQPMRVIFQVSLTPLCVASPVVEAQDACLGNSHLGTLDSHMCSKCTTVLPHQ